jgi:hypothetical protein
VYAGTTREGRRRIPHRIVFTVTDLTKVIDGVPTVVVWAEDYKAGKLEEAEIAFFAQDNDGNVWQMGEYPEEYENGKVVKAPAWIAGVEDARPGIYMKAKPEPGTPSYSQGWGPAVEWTDRGRVEQVGQKVCIRKDCYEDVLVIAEHSQAEGPAAEQLKYYARGVGKIQVGWRGRAETLQESLTLVKVSQLSLQALASARAKALALDKHAYTVSKTVYSQTQPAEQMRTAEGQ